MTEQKYLEAIKKFRLIDDTFFSACFDNNATDVQYILRIILETRRASFIISKCKGRTQAQFRRERDIIRQCLIITN